MSITKDSINNFFGGVSQQTDKLMYPQQAKQLVNFLPDVVEGLKKRPPLMYVAKLNDATYSSVYPYIQTVIKEYEEYLVLLDGTTCKVFDLLGNEKTVTISSNASSYIASQSPSKNLTTVTLGDYTFILNKSKTVQIANDTYSSGLEGSAIVFVKQGNFNTEYTLTISGTTITITTSEDEAPKIRTNYIAGLLKTAIEENGTLDALVTVTRKGSTLYITKKTSSNFTIEASDSNGNQNLFAFKGEATTSTDLPIVAPNGYILKITQNAKDGVNNYYVKFQTNNKSLSEGTVATGEWVECPQPKIKYKLNKATMPMVLIRQSNGTFTLGEASWGERLAGDEETAPNPSFIGQKIKEVYIHKGRLGLIANDKAVLSDVNNIFSFFKKTVLSNLDTDPIDIGSNSKMVDLVHSLPFNEELVLFSNNSQFTLKGGDVFSNSTVSLDLATSYQCSVNCKPISLGATGYFIYENGNYSRVMEMYVTQSYTIDAMEITTQCPSYIPKNVYKLTGSTANHTMIALSSEERGAMYVYNFYLSDREHVQSAWSKWKFNDDIEILNADFNNHLLYVVYQKTKTTIENNTPVTVNNGVYLGVIDFTSQLTEDNLNFLLYLDEKAYVTLSDSAYDSANDVTNYLLPYQIITPENFRVVDENGFELLTELIPDSNNRIMNIAIKGRHLSFVIGNVYNSKWQLPHFYVRQQDQTYRVREGLLMLRDMILTYANSGYFTVTVEPKFTSQMTSIFKFTGKVLGLPSCTIGTTPIESGTFLVPLIAKNDEIEIFIENNTYLPCSFISIEWLGDYVQRGGS